jgi:salicylate hydroxylase
MRGRQSHSLQTGTPLFVRCPSLRTNERSRLKVLSALGFPADWADVVQAYENTQDLACDGTLLSKSTISSLLIEKYGQPMVGMLRSYLNSSLKNALYSAGIPLESEFKVSEIVEDENQVTVTAEDGRKESGSFVIGCDGLNSILRATLLKSHCLPLEPVDFTGIVQVRTHEIAITADKTNCTILTA